MKYYCLGIFILLSIKVKTQNITKVIVVDESKITIPHATIQAKKDLSFGTISNLEGEFTVENSPYDTFIVKSIGYYDKTISLKNNDSIFLESTNYKLPEIEVVAEEPKIHQLGIHKTKKPIQWTCTKQNQQAGIFIPNEMNQEVWLKKIKVDIGYSFVPKEVRNVNLRLRIFDVDEDGFPVKDLTPQSIIFKTSHKGWNEIPIRQYKIKMPINGIVVSLEWIENEKFYMEEWSDGEVTQSYGPGMKCHTTVGEIKYKFLMFDPETFKWYDYFEYQSKIKNIDFPDFFVPSIGIEVVSY